MPVPFVDRPPTKGETEQLRLALSSFRDGTGWEREAEGGTTVAGWRQLERVVAEVLGGEAQENKGIFDVILPSDAIANTDYGISVKSKELSRRTAIADLRDGRGRLYLELANSPAKFWKALAAAGIDERAVRNQEGPGRVGAIVLATVEGWHQ